MADYVWVRDRSTGHEFAVRDRLFNEDAHERLDKSPYGRDGLPRPPKYRVPLGDQPVASAASSVPWPLFASTLAGSPVDPEISDEPASDYLGHEADYSSEEND